MPTGVEGVVLDGFPVRQAIQALEDHHDCHHRGGHGPAPFSREQVDEELVWEELVALAVQHRIEGALGQGLVAEAVQVLRQVALAFSEAEAHSSPGRG